MTTADVASVPQLETSEIQAIILTGYSHLPFSCYSFLKINDSEKAKAWLQRILPEVTHAQWTNPEGRVVKPQTALNLAVAPAGLQQLGYPADLSTTFPAEFVEGMAEPSRARRLGDVGMNAPEQWEAPWPTPDIHLLLILQVAADCQELPSEEWRFRGQEHLSRHYETYRQQFEHSGLQEIALETGYVAQDNKEHFGFRDGIAQPEIKGMPRKNSKGQLQIDPGEFLLGYRNVDQNFPPTPTVIAETDRANVLPALPVPGKPNLKDFGKNGTYLVYRKLYQDVAKYRQYFQERFPSDQQAAQLAQAKMVGRWPSGTPLLLSPEKDNPHLTHKNHFYYQEKDPHGFRCPMGAHIRRTNPRDSLTEDRDESLRNVSRRQIIRRGVSYGNPLPEGHPEDHQPRGLLFLCFNADIRRQFEFIQQTWINNPSFNNLQNERDPLVGYNPDSSDRKMTIPQDPIAEKCSLPNFVTLKGGGYFFVPSISALRYLAM